MTVVAAAYAACCSVLSEQREGEDEEEEEEKKRRRRSDSPTWVLTDKVSAAELGCSKSFYAPAFRVCWRGALRGLRNQIRARQSSKLMCSGMKNDQDDLR